MVILEVTNGFYKLHTAISNPVQLPIPPALSDGEFRRYCWFRGLSGESEFPSPTNPNPRSIESPRDDSWFDLIWTACLYTLHWSRDSGFGVPSSTIDGTRDRTESPCDRFCSKWLQSSVGGQIRTLGYGVVFRRGRDSILQYRVYARTVSPLPSAQLSPYCVEFRLPIISSQSLVDRSGYQPQGVVSG